MENKDLVLWGTIYTVKYTNIKFHDVVVIEFRISIISDFLGFTSMEISDQ